jgi:hypothetical protein
VCEVAERPIESVSPCTDIQKLRASGWRFAQKGMERGRQGKRRAESQEGVLVIAKSWSRHYLIKMSVWRSILFSVKPPEAKPHGLSGSSRRAVSEL